jgi:cytochrome c biogenesis protein CcdA
MSLFLISFIAGILTVLAPCSLTFLPVIIAGASGSKNKFRPLLIVSGLAVSIFVFSLLLKLTTLFITVPNTFWQVLAGGTLLLFGFFTVFPSLWDSISVGLNLSNKSNELLNKTSKNQEKWYTLILLGASLGPVFNSCSPTFIILLATVIIQNFWLGIINITIYILGLSLVLLAIGYTGQMMVKKLRWAANPAGNFKRILGLVFITIGLLIIFGLHKTLEESVLANGYFDFFLNFEYDALEKIEIK